MSQEELAERVNSSRQRVHDVERGFTRLNEDWARRIAGALGVAPVDLLPDEDFLLRPTDEELRLLQLIRAMPDDRRQALPGLISALIPDAA